jgi:glutathione peroxidase
MLDFTMKRIDGSDQPLGEYRGKVVLMVNVASKCGLTPQYKGLQALYEKYRGQGLEILGFPANNFMGQEPGTDDEIAAFCDTNYHVTFPLFSKISVKGDDMHPLYRALTSSPEPLGGDVQWNFQKYLVDRDGNAVAKFLPLTTPEDLAFVEAIEKLLA